MAAAAHFLHDQLYIHFIDGTRADKDLALIFGEHEARLHTLDIQKIIGRLRANDRGTLYVFRTANRDGIGISEDLRMGHSVRLGPVGHNIFTEQLADSRDVCPAAAQECCRFEGTHAASIGKVVGIHHNTAVDRIRFFWAHLDVFACILQDFRHHFTCGGRIGLHIGECRVLDHFLALSVVIQDNDRFTKLEQLRALRAARCIDVNHDQRRIIRDGFNRRHAVNDHVLAVIFVLFKQRQNLSKGYRSLVEDDISLSVQRLRNSVNAQCGAKAVGVAQTMSHDKDGISDIEDFLGYNDETDAVIVGAGKLGNALLNYSGFAAQGINIRAGFDNDRFKIGKTINGKLIYDINELKTVLPTLNAKIAIITTPASVANDVAKLLVEAGIEAIWNFSQSTIIVGNDVIVENVDLASSLAVLSHRLKEKQNEK